MYYGTHWLKELSKFRGAKVVCLGRGTKTAGYAQVENTEVWRVVYMPQEKLKGHPYTGKVAWVVIFIVWKKTSPTTSCIVSFELLP